MKNWKSIVLGLGIIFGVFLVLGSVSASEDNVLQPAEALGPTYSSIYASDLKVRGVSYLNGTIINDQSATETDPTRTRVGNFPVTIGDDLRVNGRIDRLGLGGDPVIIADNLRVDGEISRGYGAVKFADSIQPSVNGAYDLGTDSNRWRNGYFTGTVKTNKAIEIWGNSDLRDSGDGWWENGVFIYNTDVSSTTPSISLSSQGQIIGQVIDAGNLNVNYGTSLHGNVFIHDRIQMDGEICGTNDTSRLGCEEDDSASLKLDSIVNIKPRDGQPYACTDDHKGDLIFSTTAIGGQGSANRYYYCASAAEGWLQLF